MTAIVFDFDGVLADSEPLHLRVYQQLLEPHGIHLDQATYSEKYLGYDDEGVFQQIAVDYKLLLGDEEIEMLIEEKAMHFEKLVSSGNVLYPAAAACVRRLGAAYPLGIASGALRAEIELMLARRRAARRLQVHRLVGRHRAHQAGAGSLPARGGAARRAGRGVRRDRRLALGPPVGARRRHAHDRHHQHLSARDADRGRHDRRLARRTDDRLRGEAESRKLKLEEGATDP